MRFSRYLTHAVVLAVALAISGYASVDRNLGSVLSRLGAPLTAQAVMVDEGGAVGNVSFGRYSTIIAPVDIPTSAPASHLPTSYVIQSGDTLGSIASKFGITVSQIRWSNGGLFVNPAIIAGETIVIPPTPGVVVTVKSGDTVPSLAKKYQVDPSVIMDYNRLRDSQLSAGTLIVIPGGVGPAFPPPPVVYQPQLGGGGGAMPTVVKSCCLGPYVNNRFPVGWCTYYVATWRNVTWTGDAGWWYDNAKAQGYAVGPTPRVGAIMVTWESYLGHVAYVQAVNSDGSFTVSEMNYVAWDVIDWRTIKPGQLGSKLIGFIYQ